MAVKASYPKELRYTLEGGPTHSITMYAPNEQENQERWKRTNRYDFYGVAIGIHGPGRRVVAYQIIDCDGNVEKVWFQGWE